jgi:hypothetical protein
MSADDKLNSIIQSIDAFRIFADTTNKATQRQDAFIEQIKIFVESSNKNSLAQDAALSTLTAEVRSLANKVRMLEKVQRPSSSSSPLTPPDQVYSSPLPLPPPPRPKLARPEKFLGDRTLARAFYTSVKNYMHAYRDSFTTGGEKVSFFISLLDGRALIWLDSFAHRTTFNPDNWEALKDAFNLVYTDQDAERRAMAAITTIKQEALLITAYVESFRKLSNLAPTMDNDTKVYHFTRGANKTLKYAVATQPATDLEEILNFAHTFATKTGEPLPHSPTSYLDAHTPPTAMEISHVRAPLSQEEKDRRQRLGLCRYCASAAHKVDSCPIVPSNKNTSPPK